MEADKENINNFFDKRLRDGALKQTTTLHRIYMREGRQGYRPQSIGHINIAKIRLEDPELALGRDSKNKKGVE